MKKSILGVQIGITSGVALYYDGKIVFVVSEERFTKVKNETLYPHKSIEACIKFCEENNIPLPEIAIIPSYNMDFEHYLLRRECTYSIKDYIKENYEYWYKKIYEKKDIKLRDIFKKRIENFKYLDKEVIEKLYSLKDPKKLWQQIRADELKKYNFIKEVYFVNHEYSHAAYALYGSDIKDKENVLVVAIDGFGDESNASIWTYKNNQLKLEKKYTSFNVGRVYRYITLLLGMKPSEHEHKVMGLAPYSNEKYSKEAYEIFKEAWYFENGEVKTKTNPQDSYFYFKEKLEGIRFDSIAGGLQQWAEYMILSLISFWSKKLQKSKVVVSGGVSLNIKANMHIGELENIEDIFVPASGGDESLCIGAIYSYLDEQKRSNDIQYLNNMYLGNSYKYDDIKNKVKNFIKNKEYKVNFEATYKDIAKLLSEDKVVGRFVGRMEFGARSLGNRAILANPSKKDVVRVINSKIKKRDFWMPFSPSILDFKADEYLINPKNFRFPFMTVACKTTKKAQEEIFGALHPSDFTARPQIVTKEINEDYWNLINEFYNLTGIGAVLNTSLNLSGLPICESPEDVFNVFENSDIDAIYLEGILIER